MSAVTEALKWLGNGRLARRKAWRVGAYLDVGINGDIVMCREGGMAAWNPTSSDILADDWEEGMRMPQVLGRGKICVFSSLRRGERVRRMSWPMGMYVYAKQTVEFGKVLVIHLTNGEEQPFAFSVFDMRASDWDTANED